MRKDQRGPTGHRLGGMPSQEAPKGVGAFGSTRPSSRKREPGLATVELSATGMDPSIHSDVFARYERGVLEIGHCVKDVRNFTHPCEGMKLRQRRMIILGVHRRVDVAG